MLTQDGFTLIELVLVILILGILLTVVAVTYGGVQAKNRNNQREADINTLQGELETYYAQTSVYPTVADLNNSAWLTKNMPDLSPGTMRDPHWSNKVAACTAAGHSTVIGSIAANCYTYQPVATDGSSCDNVKNPCAHYTLTATLEGGLKYVKSSLN